VRGVKLTRSSSQDSTDSVETTRSEFSVAHAKAQSIYNGECKALFDDMCKHHAQLSVLRAELGRYIGQPRIVRPAADAPATTPCFLCGTKYLALSVSILEDIAEKSSSMWSEIYSCPGVSVAKLPSSSETRMTAESQKLQLSEVLRVDFGLLNDLLVNSVHHGDEQTRSSVKALLGVIVARNSSAFQAMRDLLEPKIKFLVRQADTTLPGVLYCYIDLVTHLVAPSSREGQIKTRSSTQSSLRRREQLGLLFNIFFFAVQHGSSQTTVAQIVILPLLETIHNCLENQIFQQQKKAVGPIRAASPLAFHVSPSIRSLSIRSSPTLYASPHNPAFFASMGMRTPPSFSLGPIPSSQPSPGCSAPPFRRSVSAPTKRSPALRAVVGSNVNRSPTKSSSSPGSKITLSRAVSMKAKRSPSIRASPSSNAQGSSSAAVPSLTLAQRVEPPSNSDGVSNDDSSGTCNNSSSASLLRLTRSSSDASICLLENTSAPPLGLLAESGDNEMTKFMEDWLNTTPRCHSEAHARARLRRKQVAARAVYRWRRKIAGARALACCTAVFSTISTPLPPTTQQSYLEGYRWVASLLLCPASWEIREQMLMLVMTLCQGSNLERESKEREDAGSPFNALLAPLLRSADGSTTSHSRNSKLEKVAETSSSTATSTPSTSIGGVSYNKRVYLFLELMLKILREENSGIQTAANYTRREADQGQWDKYFQLLRHLLTASTPAEFRQKQVDDEDTWPEIGGYTEARRTCCRDRQHFLVVKGVLPLVMNRIYEEIDCMSTAENCSSNLVFQPQPHFLSGCISLLLLLVQTPSIRERFKSSKLPNLLLRAFLRLRGLIMQQSRLTEACAADLLKVIKTVFSGSDTDKKLMIAAYLEAFGQSSTVVPSSMSSTPLPTASASSPSSLSGTSDSRTAIFVLEQLCQIIKPDDPPRHCFVILKKASTQEDFIRGSMKQNPYCSSDFKGGTMNDVKNKICQDLGLEDSANMFELLVANKIVSLELPIIKVYDKIWREEIENGGSEYREGGDSDNDDFICEEMPMTIVYRLTGLDGEATEDVVESIEDDTQKIDPEVEFILAAGMSPNSLKVLFDRLGTVNLSTDVERRLAGMLVKTLAYCCKLRENRETVLLLTAVSYTSNRLETGAAATVDLNSLGFYCVNVLVYQLVLVLRRTSSSISAASVPSNAFEHSSDEKEDDNSSVYSSQLLELISSLLREKEVVMQRFTPALGSAKIASSSAPNTEQKEREQKSESVPRQDPTLTKPLEEQSRHLHQLLQCLPAFSTESESSKKFATEIMSILPGLTYGAEGPMRGFLSLMKPFLRWEAYDSGGYNDQDWCFYLDCFAHFTEHIPNTPGVGVALRKFFFDQGVVQTGFEYIVAASAVSTGKKKRKVAKKKQKVEHSKKEENQQKVKLVDRPSCPALLASLTGLVKGFEPSQELARQMGVLDILHRLEGITSSKKVGPIAENLLQAMRESNPKVCDHIDGLREATREGKKALAMKKRKKILDQMGIKRSKTNPSILKADRQISGLSQLEEAKGLQCMICHEGYEAKPQQLLGFYVFNKDVPFMMDDERGVTTVTHFNPIHFQCHREAVRSDRRLKPPKSEWEGAAIRNSHTLCNNLFPILGPAAGLEDAYSSKVADYWSNMRFRDNFTLTRFELLVEDLRMLIARFAYEESFSDFSKGGGKESNIKMIPFMIQMALHLFKTNLNSADQVQIW